MPTIRVALNRTTKGVTLLGAADAIPGGSTVVGTFDHGSANDALQARDSHVAYHHVRDILYHENILDMQSVRITSLVDLDDADTGPNPGPRTIVMPQSIRDRWAVTQIFSEQDGVYATNFNIQSLLPNPVRTIFLDPTGGNSANDGLTRQTAKQNLSDIMTVAQPGDHIRVINLTADLIIRNQWRATGGGFAGTIAFINESTTFNVVLAGASATLQNWTVNATHSNVMSVVAGLPSGITDTTVKHYPFYQTAEGSGYALNDTVTLSNGAIIQATGVVGGAVTNWNVIRLGLNRVVGAVTQTAASGSGTGIAFRSLNTARPIFAVARRVQSLADCAAQRGTWFHDGTNLHFHTVDDRVVTGGQVGIIVGATNVPGAVTANTSASAFIQYFDGIDFVGGQTGFLNDFAETTNRTVFAFRNCSMQGSRDDGIRTYAMVDHYYENVGVYYNGLDGIGHHNKGGPTIRNTSPRCMGRVVTQGNGTIGSANATITDNDFTLHEDAVAVLINSYIIGSDDRNLANINDTRMVMLGGYIGSPKSLNGADDGSSVSLTNTASLHIDGTEVRRTSAPGERFRLGTGTSLAHRGVTPVPTTSGNGTITAWAA